MLTAVSYTIHGCKLNVLLVHLTPAHVPVDVPRRSYRVMPEYPADHLQLGAPLHTHHLNIR